MYTALEQIKLQTIDFNWIQNTTKISHLKRAIKLIQLDACYKRLEQLDPTQKRVQFNNHVNQEVKKSLQSEIDQWEKQIQGKNTSKNIFETNLQDYQSYFIKEQKPKELKKAAENQRNKGNQAIKSKDYDQAITYYTKSLSLEPGMYQSYSNRALAYLKKKQFQKCLQDCQSALRLNPKYTKAIHRKSKAYIGLKNRIEGYKCLQEIIKLEPQNNEINGQIQQLWQEMTEKQKSELSSIQKNQFKRIAIEEDSDDQDQ